MRIRQLSSTSQSSQNSRYSFILRAVVYLLTAVVLLATGYFLGLKHPAVFDRPWRSVLAVVQRTKSVPALYLDIPFTEYQRLLSQRDVALQKGANVYSRDVDGWGDGQLRFENHSTSIALRLLAAPAPEFSGDHWPLEIDCAGSEGCLDMQRAQLQPVKDEVAVWSAGLLTSMEDAGAITVAYRWVRLYVNGNAWGMYVLYESPLSLDSPIVIFDSTAWLEMLPSSGAYSPPLTYPYSQVVMSNVADPSLQPELEAAKLALLRLMHGDTAAITAIDIESWGRYLALRTLWCGSMQPDWRTSAWTYDSDSSRLFPVGVPCTPVTDDEHILPPSFFTDLGIQKSLVQELQLLGSSPLHISREALAEVKVLYTMTVPLAKDMPTPDQWLEQRQEQISSLLSPSKSLLVRVSSETIVTMSSTQTSGSPLSVSQPILYLDVVNLSPVPIQVLGLDMNENGFVPADPIWVEGNSANRTLVLPASYGSFPVTVPLQIPLNELVAYGDEDMWLVARVWGVEPFESLPQFAVKVQAGVP